MMYESNYGDDDQQIDKKYPPKAPQSINEDLGSDPGLTIRELEGELERIIDEKLPGYEVIAEQLEIKLDEHH